MTFVQKGFGAVVALALGASSQFGCKQEWSIYKAPQGYAVVRAHLVYAPRHVPPLVSKLDFTIVEVDGRPVEQEQPPPWADIYPGALVTAGTHSFKANVLSHVHRIGEQPKQVSFTATVQSGKVYELIDDDRGMPILIEDEPGG